MCKRTSLRVRQLAIVAIAWVTAGLMIAGYDLLLLQSYGTAADRQSMSVAMSLAINAGTGLVGALLGGSFLVFFVNDRFQNKPYAYTILSVALFFLFVVLVVCVMKALVLNPPKGRHFFSLADMVFTMDSAKLKNILTWFVIVCLTQLFLQMNSRIGNSNFSSVFSGRYNVPREEKKIFMFLDINSSTAIAEWLGDERYHELLRDFFSDISNPIVESGGSIYQYVGDEVVVAWDYAEGIRENRCIACFFEIKKLIAANEHKYHKRYGLVPSFKAGFHSGKVIAGQVGTLKREITYSGDVLNTTARMLAMCKDFGVEVITSGILLSELCLDKTFDILQLGSMKLRGKEHEVVLNGIRSRIAQH